jgi:hypothetical protein
MAFSDIYRRQVKLLIRTLPAVAEEGCFALKGGTAINLFVRNLPRLSVDIDLTYLPVAGREVSLAEIDAALKRIAKRIKDGNPKITVAESRPGTQTSINKLVVRTPDLFDVYHLLQIEGIDEKLRTAIIVYLISHDHAPHALLSPKCRDITHDFEHNFQGMTDEEVSCETLVAAHGALVRDVLEKMPPDHRRFLKTFYLREPDWSLLGIKGLDRLPAVRWREINLDKAGKDAQADIVEKLRRVLHLEDAQKKKVARCDREATTAGANKQRPRDLPQVRQSLRISRLRADAPVTPKCAALAVVATAALISRFSQVGLISWPTDSLRNSSCGTRLVSLAPPICSCAAKLSSSTAHATIGGGTNYLGAKSQSQRGEDL